MIAGFVDTSDKVINLSPVTTEPMTRVFGMSMGMGAYFFWQFALNYCLPCPTSAAGDIAVLV